MEILQALEAINISLKFHALMQSIHFLAVSIALTGIIFAILSTRRKK